jgi:hypothetical protein
MGSNENGGNVQLYCNPATSEVTGEYPTLHEAIDSNVIATGSRLTCNGFLLAIAWHGGWVLEREGVARLVSEYELLSFAAKRP